MKVSVIIPTYNRANLLSCTIDSVLAQTFSDYEIIVMDDGSTDNTEQMIRKYGERVRYYRQENCGVNSARNHAIRLAKGEYIALLDNDDLWLPEKLALQVELLDQHNELACLFTNFNIYKSGTDFTPDGIQTWYDSPKDWRSFYRQSYQLGDLITDIPNGIDGSVMLYIGDIYGSSMEFYFVLPSTALYRRSMVSNGIEFIEYDPICGDWDFFARLSRDHPVGYLDLETVHNRSHEDAVRLTRTAWVRQIEFRIDMLERLYFRDKDYLAENRANVERVYIERIKKLIIQYLLSGNKLATSEALHKLSSVSSSAKIDFLGLWVMNKIPKVHVLLQGLRSLRSRGR